MRRTPATLELAPLDDYELAACLGFLTADLDSRRQREKLAQAIRPILRRKGQPIIEAGFVLSFLVDPFAFDGLRWDEAGTRMLRARAGDKNATTGGRQILARLRQSQIQWRRLAHGPQSPILSSRERRGLDVWVSSSGDLRLPAFQFGTRFIGSGLRVVQPILWIGSAADLFNWLLLRAAANLQVSRFAHCIVCGRWTIKKRAGQRSAATSKYLRDWLQDPRRKKLEGFPLTLRDSWPEPIRAFPMWPAVCENRVCRTFFQNVVGGRTRFRRENFLGLTWNGKQHPGRGDVAWRLNGGLKERDRGQRS